MIDPPAERTSGNVRSSAVIFGGAARAIRPQDAPCSGRGAQVDAYLVQIALRFGPARAAVALRVALAVQGVQQVVGEHAVAGGGVPAGQLATGSRGWYRHGAAGSAWAKPLINGGSARPRINGKRKKGRQGTGPPRGDWRSKPT